MTLRKGVWSPEEDKKLIAYINRYGIWNWTKMPEPAGLSRSGKSCRLRWLNYLRPNVKHGEFTKEEDKIITRMHQLLGNKWSTIAAALPGRTDNEIKNHWHTRIQKRPRRRVAKHPQVSMTDDFDSQLNQPFPKENYSDSPISMSPYILDSSAETSSSTSASSSRTNYENSEQKALESPDVLSYFQEDLYPGNQHHILEENSGFREFWDPEPMSPFGFYTSSSYTSYDLSSNFPVTEDVEGVFIDHIFQF